MDVGLIEFRHQFANVIGEINVLGEALNDLMDLG
jgi:hypothetical protein